MIYVGTDIEDRKRLIDLISKYEEKFNRLLLHENEQHYPVRRKATVFVIKEAFYKAFCQKMNSKVPIDFRKIEVVYIHDCIPSIILHGEFKKYIENISVSASHTKDILIATVIIT